MRTAFISHPECALHDTGDDHPECARRISAISDQLIFTGLSDLLRHIDAPLATDKQLLRAHSPHHLGTVASAIPASGHARLDPDTVIGHDSLRAARRAAGAVVAAVDLVLGGETDSAFCCVRPPGHHAERNKAMGFCLYNNIAVGAAHALDKHGLDRIAIVDFDVHHGNGTEDIFSDDERVLFCSTFEHPFFPFTPLLANTANRVSVPLAATATGGEFRAAVTEHWLPALEAFEPKLVFVSAGFDAHVADEMSHVRLTDADFRWVTEQILQVATRSASNRVISSLEGGYELESLARCVEAHIRLLMGLH